jgi:hypothetical protein
MSKLIKRADGSYSKRGLWDNIRANKGSGEEPSEKILEQARKIKNEDKMKMEYKRGGKSTKTSKAKPKMKESWMEESKEVHFGNKPKPMEYKEGGKKARLENRAERKLGRAQKNYNKAQEAIAADEANPSTTTNAPAYINKKLDRAMILEDKARALKAKADAMKKGGFPDLNKDGKSRFQEMAAAGRSKKEMGGMAEELEMETEESTEMMETTEAAKRRKKKKKKKGPCTGSNCFKNANKKSGMKW